MKNQNQNPLGARCSVGNGSSTSSQARTARYVSARRSGASPRSATHSYVAGNKWATENAKAVGNI